VLIRGHTATKAAGHVIITSADGSSIEQDTIQCVHCQRHWQVIPGSGRKRGFCRKCMGPTCGSVACDESCYPFEKRLDHVEIGKLPDWALADPGKAGIIIP